MKLSKLTVFSYAVFAATGLSLLFLERSLEADPGTFVRLLLLTLVLSLASIGFGLLMIFQTWRRRAKVVADAVSGRETKVELEPGDRIMRIDP